MELTAAILCDHASVHDGLLFVSGGGINLLTRPEYPSLAGAMLAIQFSLSREDYGPQHDVTVTLRKTGDPEAIWTLVGRFMNTGDLDRPGNAHTVADMRTLPIPEAGTYQLDVTADGQQRRLVPFYAVVGDAPPPPQPGAV